MKHTPGPWNHILNTTSITAERPFICGDVRPPIPIATVCCNDLASEQANARLIAACPSLLSACEQALYRMTTLASRLDGRKDLWTDDERDAIEMCRAAISRATGND